MKCYNFREIPPKKISKPIFRLVPFSTGAFVASLRPFVAFSSVSVRRGPCPETNGADFLLGVKGKCHPDCKLQISNLRDHA